MSQGTEGGTGGKGKNWTSASGGTTSPKVDYRQVADMIRQSEEKQDVKLNAIETRIESKLSSVATVWTIWAAVGSAVAAILGIGLGILALSGDRFDGGIAFGRSVGDDLLKNRMAIEDSQNATKALNEKLDKILEKVSPPK